MNAAKIVVVADRLKARVQGGFLILEVGFLPSWLADDVSFPVADIPGRVPQVFRLAGMVVDVQSCEPVGGGGVAHSQERDDQDRNHSLERGGSNQMKKLLLNDEISIEALPFYINLKKTDVALSLNMNKFVNQCPKSLTFWLIESISCGELIRPFVKVRSRVEHT